MLVLGGRSKYGSGTQPTGSCERVVFWRERVCRRGLAWWGSFAMSPLDTPVDSLCSVITGPSCFIRKRTWEFSTCTREIHHCRYYPFLKIQFIEDRDKHLYNSMVMLDGIFRYFVLLSFTCAQRSDSRSCPAPHDAVWGPPIHPINTKSRGKTSSAMM